MSFQKQTEITTFDIVVPANTVGAVDTEDAVDAVDVAGTVDTVDAPTVASCAGPSFRVDRSVASCAAAPSPLRRALPRAAETAETLLKLLRDKR